MTVLPFAKSIDEITQTGFYMTPDGALRVSVYPHRHLPCVKEYIYIDKGLGGIITEDGRHYVRDYSAGAWSAWRLKT